MKHKTTPLRKSQTIPPPLLHVLHPLLQAAFTAGFASAAAANPANNGTRVSASTALQQTLAAPALLTPAFQQRS